MLILFHLFVNNIFQRDDFFMNKQEYKHIRNLAWDLLIDANISSLPINVTQIAALYNLESLINISKSRYENTLLVSKHILNILGYDISFAKMLTIRILSPMIILKSLNIKTPLEINHFTDLPLELCYTRFECYQMLLTRNAFSTSKLETKVLSQFQDWINSF